MNEVKQEVTFSQDVKIIEGKKITIGHAAIALLFEQTLARYDDLNNRHIELRREVKNLQESIKKRKEIKKKNLDNKVERIIAACKKATDELSKS